MVPAIPGRAAQLVNPNPGAKVLRVRVLLLYHVPLSLQVRLPQHEDNKVRYAQVVIDGRVLLGLFLRRRQLANSLDHESCVQKLNIVCLHGPVSVVRGAARYVKGVVVARGAERGPPWRTRSFGALDTWRHFTSLSVTSRRSSETSNSDHSIGKGSGATKIGVGNAATRLAVSAKKRAPADFSLGLSWLLAAGAGLEPATEREASRLWAQRPGLASFCGRRSRLALPPSTTWIRNSYPLIRAIPTNGVASASSTAIRRSSRSQSNAAS